MLYKKKAPLFVFIIPGIIFLVVFLYYPFIRNIYNSFFNMTQALPIPGQPRQFLGFDNFKTLFTDKAIGVSLKNSVIMMFLTVIFQVGLGLVFAILVSNIKRGQQFFRTVYFFPVVISASALGLLFKLLYNFDNGMLNQLLRGMGKEPILWLGEGLAFIMICIPVLWSYVGFYFVIMLTGILDISDDIFEAAAIDGCTKLKQVFYITLPLLRGVICTCVTLAVTGALKVFDLPWNLAEKGAPGGTTHFLGTYMYQTAYGSSNYDYGATIALLIVVLGVIVSKVVGRLLKPDANL